MLHQPRRIQDIVARVPRGAHATCVAVEGDDPVDVVFCRFDVSLGIVVLRASTDDSEHWLPLDAILHVSTAAGAGWQFVVADDYALRCDGYACAPVSCVR